MNWNDVTKFITATVGAVVCIALAIAGWTQPPLLSMPDGVPLVLLVAGLASLGVQVTLGYQASRMSASVKARDR